MVFFHVPYGIILEDDCLPHYDFFEYCEELLLKYRYDERVVSISGDNSAGLDFKHNEWSYSFIRCPLVWGWASWSRAWRLHDKNMQKWVAIRNTPIVEEIFYSKEEAKYMSILFDRLYYKEEPCTWDYQFMFTCMSSDLLCVIPRYNLITNIGFDDSATHTNLPGHRSYCPSLPIMPLNHPPQPYLDRTLDRQVYSRIHNHLATVRN